MDQFVAEITPEEAQAGFTIIEEENGVRVAALRLRGGLRAVKVRRDDGRTTYAICDEGLTPLYTPALTLSDLTSRFGIRRTR